MHTFIWEKPTKEKGRWISRNKPIKKLSFSSPITQRRKKHWKELNKVHWVDANFNPTERILYSHDIAAIPSLFKPLIGKTVPQAVVPPENEEQLVELVCWASENKIPIVPRGKGSSGYQGHSWFRRHNRFDVAKAHVRLLIKKKAGCEACPSVVFCV